MDPRLKFKGLARPQQLQFPEEDLSKEDTAALLGTHAVSRRTLAEVPGSKLGLLFAVSLIAVAMLASVVTILIEQQYNEQGSFEKGSGTEFSESPLGLRTFLDIDTDSP